MTIESTARDRCRVILVRTHYPGNLGSTARVMRNFGLRDLVLVAPSADPLDREALRLATHGEEILTSARIVGELTEALADCSCAIATSASTAGLFREGDCGPPDEILARALPWVVGGRLALVFGPEPSGLTNQEISRCRFLLHIPTAPEYPALNLAQAVTICLYELHRLLLQGEPPQSPREGPPAPLATVERMFAELESGLRAIHFLFGPKSTALMHYVRRLLGRTPLTDQDTRVLFGLARQLHWIASRAEQRLRDEGSAVPRIPAPGMDGEPQAAPNEFSDRCGST